MQFNWSLCLTVFMSLSLSKIIQNIYTVCWNDHNNWLTNNCRLLFWHWLLVAGLVEKINVLAVVDVVLDNESLFHHMRATNADCWSATGNPPGFLAEHRDDDQPVLVLPFWSRCRCCMIAISVVTFFAACSHNIIINT